VSFIDLSVRLLCLACIIWFVSWCK